MSLRNDPEISAFGHRLFALIDEADRDVEDKKKRISSPKGLAKRLFDLELVHVNSKKDVGNSEDKIRENAIVSIEGTIVNHIKTGKIIDKKGEFLIAYCKFFHCSADYILGLTDIRTPDVEVRTICEKTLLSEKAVKRLIEREPLGGMVDFRKHPVPRELWSDCWSLMIESSLFETLPADWGSLCREIQEYNKEESEIIANQKLREKITDEDLRTLYDNMCRELQVKVERHESAYYGYLAKISRDVSNCLDEAATDIHNTADIKDRELKDAMFNAEKLVNKFNEVL